MKRKAREEIDIELKKFEQALQDELNEKLTEKKKEIEEEIKGKSLWSFLNLKERNFLKERNYG